MSNRQRPDFSDSGSDFSEGIAPDFVEHSDQRVKNSFRPWHKPRKQWIRNEQWGSSINQLIDKIGLRDSGEPLHYFSLPGPDLLDVRSLLPICQAQGVTLKFLGIDSGDGSLATEAALNLAMLNQVRSLPHIDQSSEVVPDKFEHLAKPTETAYQRVIVGRKSYDVVNIDLCGSIAEGPSGVGGANIVNALYSLLKHQANTRKSDWILFLTTRADEEKVDPGTMKRFADWINKKIEESPDFKNGLTKEGLLLAQDFIGDRLDLSRLNTSSYCNSFAIGVSNWILSSLIENEPAWRVDMLPLYSYHVAWKDGTCDMLSLGFYCKRLIPAQKEDAFGIARPILQNPSPPNDEINTRCIEKINARVIKATDLDVRLNHDKELYKSCMDSAVDFLKQDSRYDEAKYKEWAEKDYLRTAEMLMANNLGLA